MRRLRLELKQTMDLYSNACKEALSAKQQVRTSHPLVLPLCEFSEFRDEL